MLWHGSRVSNFGGILSQGLRIAPPEAPVNGYAYGKGVYLSNYYGVSKSYSMPYLNDRLILLCRSSLGKIGQYKGFDYFNKHNRFIEEGYHSSIGFAQKTIPAKDYDTYDKMQIPVRQEK